MDFTDAEYKSFLRDEYLLLQNQYEDYDRRSITIKGWVSSGMVAGLAFSLTKDAASPFIPFIIALFALVFWWLEASWKIFQYAIVGRIRILEANFRNDPDILYKNPPPFQVYHWWYKTFANDEPIFVYETTRRRRHWVMRVLRVATQPFVQLPYSIIIILAAIIFITDITAPHAPAHGKIMSISISEPAS